MTQSKTEFRLCMSPLTRIMYAGRVQQKDGYAVSTGVRHDVTNDFYACLIQLAQSHGGEFKITGGNETWDVAVTKRPAGEGA
jgi:hypothetical protein